MKEAKIKVLALLPMELPKEVELDNTLEAILPARPYRIFRTIIVSK